MSICRLDFWREGSCRIFLLEKSDLPDGSVMGEME